MRRRDGRPGGVHSILGVIGLSAREPLTVPGNKYVFGLIHRAEDKPIIKRFSLRGPRNRARSIESEIHPDRGT